MYKQMIVPGLKRQRSNRPKPIIEDN